MNTHMTALVVDDEPLVQILLTNILNKFNFEVVKGSNGAEAITQFVLNRPSLIIIDMNMPLLNGCEAARLIRGMHQGDKCDIILFTTESKAYLREQGVCRSIDYIVDKTNLTELQKLITDHKQKIQT